MTFDLMERPMQRQNKLYASITDMDGRTLPRIEVRDMLDAIKTALDYNGVFFHTFEVPTAIICGKRLEGAPENFSAPVMIGNGRTVFDVNGHQLWPLADLRASA
jgi:hypothetical protein